ncbi:hypothetical protein EDB85DRAFT_1892595 [Lactarius pseudohatsudake]|nr:hypothetical protein EDB85DRAFT_1892595 [Lactarius pseudohatsudake]
MGPKASRAKGKKVQPATTIQEGGTTFGQFEKAELRESKKEAEMGYMTMNLASPPSGAYWGRFNDRVVNEDWVKSLMEAYSRCLDNCLDDTAVDVAVKRSWIRNAENIVPSVEGKNVKTVGKIEFTSQGKEEMGSDNLWILGGNHRRQALLRHLEGRQKELDKLKNQLAKKEGKGGEDDEEVEAMRKDVREKEEEISTNSLWAVRLYDRARTWTEKIDAYPAAKATAIYRFLSRNETKDKRMATDEERLIEIVDELKDAYEEDVRHRKDRAKNLDAAALYQTFMKKAKIRADAFKDSRDRGGHRQLCSVPSFALALVAASRIRRHYTHARWFRVADLVKILESHGALISEFIVESVETLERVANPARPPLEYEEIEELGQQLLEANGDADVDAIREKLAKMKTAFEDMGDASDWTHELLGKIDQCFKEAYYVNEEPSESLFVPLSSDNDNRFDKYVMSVDKVLQNESQTAPPYAREYFAYAMMWKLHGHKFPMPLGTASVVEALHKIANKYPLGISEVRFTVFSVTNISVRVCPRWTNAGATSPSAFVHDGQTREQYLRPRLSMVDKRGDDISSRVCPSWTNADGDSVISWIGTGLHWGPKMGSKVYIIYDSFDAALESASKDILIKQNAIGVRRKLIRIILAHLTTSIVEIDSYLLSCPTPRSMVTDLSAFKFVSSLGHDLVKGKSAKKQKDPEDTPPPGRDAAVVVAEFLAAVGWTSDNLTREFIKVNAALTASKEAFTREQRLSPHVGTRLLTMSALPRNPDSQNKKRDYALIAAAIAVESALVDKYRAHLLGQCPGARDLRGDLYSFFFSITMPHTQNYLPNAKKDVKRVWEFPDGLQSDSVTSGARARDVESINARWLAAKESYVKEKKDPVLSVVQNLEKNRLLLCSDTTVPSGTVETLAHHLISGLSEIMYKNKARIAHASTVPDADDGPLFDMSSVLVPSIPRAPHDITEHYRDQLGYGRWSIHPSAYDKAPLRPRSPSSPALSRQPRPLLHPRSSTEPGEEENDEAGDAHARQHADGDSHDIPPVDDDDDLASTTPPVLRRPSSPTPAQRRNLSPARSEHSSHDSSRRSSPRPRPKRSAPTSPENKPPSKKPTHDTRNSSKSSKKTPRARPVAGPSASFPDAFQDDTV